MAVQQNNKSTARNQSKGNNFSIKDFLLLCLSQWPWFVAILFLSLLFAFLYLKKQQPTYVRMMEVMIKEDSKSSSFSSQMGSLADMGMFKSSSSVDNELLAVKSPYVMLEVVRRLHLDVNYTTGGYRKYTLYGKNQPLIVNFSNLTDDDYISMKVKLEKSGALTITDIVKNLDKYADEVKGRINSTVTTPIGKLVITEGQAFSAMENDMEIKVSRSPILRARQSCVARFDATIESKLASVILMNYRDVSTERADDVLNAVIQVYQEYWLKDKNQIANSTSQFIDERLEVIEKELGNVDNDISSYKSRNLIPDIVESTRLSMRSSSEASARLVDLNNQMYMVNYIRDYVRDASKRNQTMPAGLIPQNPGLESLISNYNALQLQRNNLVANSSESNPLVADLDTQINSLRNSISSTIDNVLNQLKIQIKGVQGHESENNAQIASSPTQAKHLLSVERQQKVKEALYIFLLQKREENQLSQAFTAYNTRIITPPMGDSKPASPKKRRIMMMALLFGLGLPAAFFYIRETTNTKIRGKKDLETLTVPYVGEIPLYGDKKQRADAEKKILVQPKKRNMINEAFRVVRTNLEFMANSYEDAKVFMVISFNVGSGKTFMTINVASSFAIKDKKTIVIDLDLRKASLARYLSISSKGKGVASLLSGQDSDWKSLIVHSEECPQLDILPCGTTPPNPAELLSNGKLEQLIAELREEYDYIFLDCAPVDIVADTSIIAGLADMTLFIVRNGLLDKDMIPVVEEYYTSKKLKNMAILLNGTEVIRGRYGYHRHGYGYGYGYGYGSKGYGSYTKEG